jgi:glyoxylase-like metal-dependent hydrolase (beta-lactamase superfamily II)
MGLHLFGCVCGHIHSKGALMGMAEEHVSVPVPFYVIEHEKGVVLFDCGMPAAMRDPNETYLTALRSAGMDVEIGAGETVTGRLHGLDIDPARVRFVVLSHLHFDHCGGLAELPNAKIVVQAREWAAGADRDLAARHYLRRNYFDLGHERLEIEGEHDLFGDATLTCLPSPGHTPGHQSLRVRGQQGEFILVADACYNREVVQARTFPPGADAAACNRSLDALLALRGPDAVMIWGHDPAQWGARPILPGARIGAGR